MSVDRYYDHPKEIGLATAWETLEAAEARVKKELEQAQRDLETCTAIRKRLESAREFKGTFPKRPGPFAELLKLIQ